jgi:HK97 gp10 family phage protein
VPTVADFRVDGVDQIRTLARDMDLSSFTTVKKVRDAVRKHAFAVERGAKLRAPVDTGALRNSINTSFSGSSKLAPLSGTGLAPGEPVAAEVGPEVNYAPHLEFGTWKMAPRPFLGPAFDEVEPSFLAALEDIAGGALG